MYQFIESGDSAWSDLEQRARRACVVFRDQEMPPGSAPPQARIGLEIDPTTRAARLYVERGVAWQGDAPPVRAWLAAGQHDFADFGQLRAWVQHDLARCYPRPVRIQTPAAPLASLTSSLPEEPPSPPDQLTDLTQVVLPASPARQAHFVDADALYTALAQQVRGQEAPLRTLAQGVAHHLARRAPRRPATFFAVGPTGVGKTKTAETLPAALRQVIEEGAGYGYLRLDMAEYQERHRISQLLGAPPGYIGYDDGAHLTRALTANPRTTVLFDEIEKAHPDILRTLMNAMDAGRLTAANGQAERRWEIDCRHAIFFFTSNLETEGILADLAARQGFDETPVVDQVCRARLRLAGIAPELIGRIGRFLVFQPLTPTVQAEIVALSIAMVAAEYGIVVRQIAPAVISFLLAQTRTHDYGVRPYEYLIDDLLGPLFAGAAASEGDGPFAVAGPPLTCSPLGDPT